MTKEQENLILEVLNELANMSGISKKDIIKSSVSVSKEKNEEIEKLKKGQHSLMKSRKKWKNRYYKLKVENKKLNKVIDLMSEMLTTPIHSKEWVRQYYENKAKEN